MIKLIYDVRSDNRFVDAEYVEVHIKDHADLYEVISAYGRFLKLVGFGGELVDKLLEDDDL